MGIEVPISKKIAERVANPWDAVCGYYITKYSLSKELGVLPKAGGLEDQDWLMLRFFSVIAQAVGEETAKAVKK